MATGIEPQATCPTCGASEWTTEPATDEEGVATGAFAVVCAGCGHEVGELPSQEPAPEAEPEPSGAVPPPDEEGPVPLGGRRRGHRVWP